MLINSTLMKNIIYIFIFAISVFSCSENKTADFIGTWTSTSNDKDVLIITNDSESMTVLIDKKNKSLPAYIQGDTLKIIFKKDTLSALLNDQRELVINSSEKKKINGIYTLSSNLSE